MRRDGFGNWLGGQGMLPGPINSVISRCERIERDLSVDLDSEAAKDGGCSLIDRLNYTREDQARKQPAPSGIVFKPSANIYDGMASLKSAAKKYFEYCCKQ